MQTARPRRFRTLCRSSFLGFVLPIKAEHHPTGDISDQDRPIAPKHWAERIPRSSIAKRLIREQGRHPEPERRPTNAEPIRMGLNFFFTEPIPWYFVTLTSCQGTAFSLQFGCS